MKRGIVIGKFMPLHQGHIALIRFAAGQCDEVIVSMRYMHRDPIPGLLRFEWIKEEFEQHSKIKPKIWFDDFDDEALAWSQRILRWGLFLKKRFPAIHYVFSSEEYGLRLAKNLGAEHISFDPGRKQFPVSGSLIRERPFRHWDFIAAPARAYFVKKICFNGPESTGKSTIAKHLAEFYHTEFVPEVAREFISSNDFTEEDIIRIGHAQTERFLQKARTANKLLFCDTDLITTQIYSLHYLNVIPPVLYELEKRIKFDLYFLFDTDVPWVADGLRDLGSRREEMYTVFKQELVRREIVYSNVRGDFGSRTMTIQTEVNRLVESLS